MSVLYRVKYYTTKGLLTVFGPAQLNAGDDPMERLERQRDAKLGPREEKPAKPHVHKRSFTSGTTKATKSSSTR